MIDRDSPEKGVGAKKRNKKKLNPKTKEKPKYKNYFLEDIEDDDSVDWENLYKKDPGDLPYDPVDQLDL